MATEGDAGMGKNVGRHPVGCNRMRRTGRKVHRRSVKEQESYVGGSYTTYWTPTVGQDERR